MNILAAQAGKQNVLSLPSWLAQSKTLPGDHTVWSLEKHTAPSRLIPEEIPVQQEKFSVLKEYCCMINSRPWNQASEEMSVNKNSVLK